MGTHLLGRPTEKKMAEKQSHTRGVQQSGLLRLCQQRATQAYGAHLQVRSSQREFGCHPFKLALGQCRILPTQLSPRAAAVASANAVIWSLLKFV